MGEGLTAFVRVGPHEADPTVENFSCRPQLPAGFGREVFPRHGIGDWSKCKQHRSRRRHRFRRPRLVACR